MVHEASKIVSEKDSERQYYLTQTGCFGLNYTRLPRQHLHTWLETTNGYNNADWRSF